MFRQQYSITITGFIRRLLGNFCPIVIGYIFISLEFLTVGWTMAFIGGIMVILTIVDFPIRRGINREEKRGLAIVDYIDLIQEIAWSTVFILMSAIFLSLGYTILAVIFIIVTVLLWIVNIFRLISK